MNWAYETKKYGADKIILLGLFAVSLLIAHFIVQSKSIILFSGPVRLNYAGLSVSMPAGNGWQADKQWKYHENAFTLNSSFSPGTKNPLAKARCRYLPAAPKQAPNVLFEREASAVDGSIAQTGQSQTGVIIIDWAHIKTKDPFLDIFFGTAKLPNNNQFDIEVYQAAGDTNLAEQVFKSIAESLKFQGNQLLEAGSEIIKEIKYTGTDGFLDDRSRESFFFIKDAKGRGIGFTMDVLRYASAERSKDSVPLIDAQTEERLNVHGINLLYIRQGRYASEQVTFFKTDDRFANFAWKNEINGIAGRISTEVLLDETGIMTVEKTGSVSEGKNYQVSPAAIPELLSEFVFGRMIISGYEKIIVDMIETNGKIAPALIWKAENNAEGGYVLNVEFLNDQGSSQKVYLDSQMRIFKVLLQRGNVTVQRTEVENILREFPEQAGLILRRNKMFEQEATSN